MEEPMKTLNTDSEEHLRNITVVKMQLWKWEHNDHLVGKFQLQQS